MASLPPVGTQRVINDVVEIVVGQLEVQLPTAQAVADLLQAQVTADYFGPLTSGAWHPYRMFPKITLTGSGTVVFDGRDDSGNIFTATETYTVSNVQDLIRYPFFGDFTTEVRATITGSLIVELI